MKRNSALALAAILALAASGAGCGGQAWPPRPAGVEAGIDACAGCRMILSETSYIAQYHVRGGGVELFDDLGCLLERHAGPDCDPRGVFVHAFSGDGWVRGDQGFILQSPGLASPMGYGLAGFPDRAGAEAESARRRGGTVTPFSTLLREGLPRPGPDRMASSGSVTGG